MRPRRRFYIVSDHHLGFREIRWFRAKLSTGVGLLALAILGGVLLANHLYSDFLGIGYRRIEELRFENRVLQDQIRQNTVQMQKVERTLDRLYDRGNELRLMVDLPRIDEDTRAAGAGGKVSSHDFGLPSGDTQALLANSQSLLDKLFREIDLQRQSYEQVQKKLDLNRDLFSHLPALKPMDGYYSENGFGVRMHPVLGIYRTHEGLDIINDVGTPVYAAGDGVVEYAGHTGGGYGIAIVINHGFGYQTLYAHMSKLLVREGRSLKRGDPIGRSGRSGLVSGPHLHYEVRYQGVRRNPMDFFLDDLRAADYKAGLVGKN